MAGRDSQPDALRRFAYEAARWMAEQESQDYAAARRKAAERLGVQGNRGWPTNGEIQAALVEQLRLFCPGQGLELQALRRLAVQAMEAFVQFQPRLVGPVLDGTADRTSSVRLHLFAEPPEAVLHALMAQGIPWQEQDCVLRYPRGTRKSHPLLRFLAGGRGVDLVVLPLQAKGNPPLNPVTERPERGAGINQVRELLTEPTALPGTALIP